MWTNRRSSLGRTVRSARPPLAHALSTRGVTHRFYTGEAVLPFGFSSRTRASRTRSGPARSCAAAFAFSIVNCLSTSMVVL
jgi:hypothetical protein